MNQVKKEIKEVIEVSKKACQKPSSLQHTEKIPLEFLWLSPGLGPQLILKNSYYRLNFEFFKVD